jgi:hypothetical protein
MNDINTEVEQEIDIDAEINKVIFAGLTSADELKKSIVLLCGMFDVESTSLLHLLTSRVTLRLWFATTTKAKCLKKQEK